MSWEVLSAELSTVLAEYDYQLEIVPHMQSFAAQDEKKRIIYLARARRGVPVSLEDAAWSGFHDLGHVIDGRSDEEYVQEFGPTIILERACDRFGLLEAIKFFEKNGIKHSLHPEAWKTSRYSAPLHVAEWLQNLRGGAGFVNMEPKQIHLIAEALHLPDSEGSEFMDFCEKSIGKRHLDDMLPGEIQRLLRALVKWTFVRERKQALTGMQKTAGQTSVRIGAGA